MASLPMVWLSRLAAYYADAVICKSEALTHALPRGVDRSLVTIIGNGVDTAVFCPGDREAARHDLGLSGDERLILFPHDVRQKVKRFDLAQAAFAAFQARGGTGRLWVVNGVPHHKLAAYYRAADCMLLTSDHEGSPNAVKEGLCCDLPVVAVNVGDVASLVSMTPGSQLVAREPEAIASAIEVVLERRQRVDGARVRGELGLAAVADRIVQVYVGAIRRHRAP